MPNYPHPIGAYACRLLTAAFTALLSSAAFGADNSTFVDLTSGAYSARDVLPSQSVSGGFTIANGQVHIWTNDIFNGGYLGYQVGTIATGNYTAGVRPSFPLASNGFGDAFGAYDATNGLFYAGTYDNSGSGMYRYNTATQTWTNLGVFDSLYGVDIYHGEVYASGLNAIWNGSVGQGNQIALYDLTGASHHDVLVQAAGNSANVALDNQGNLYYAAYEGSDSALYKWTAARLDSVRADKGHGVAGGGQSDLFLTYSDAQKLTMLPGGANGIAVDLGGNVFITTNVFGSSADLVMWNASMGTWTTGSQDHYTRIADIDANAFGGSFGSIDTAGDFLNGGAVYVSGYGVIGLAEVTQTVPEPTSAVLLMAGIGLLGGRRKRFARV